MNIQIARNLKQFRQERNLTQEDLAAFLGVTFQAVSKWERGEGYPDISTLPSIASFFGTSVDALLGTDTPNNEQAVVGILAQSDEMFSGGKASEAAQLLRGAVKQFPGSFKLWAKLALVLLYQRPETQEAMMAVFQEVAEICERILAHCTDSEPRQSALNSLCYAYQFTGQSAKAVEIARSLPDVWHSNIILADFLTGNEKCTAVQRYIVEVFDVLMWQFERRLSDADISGKDKAGIYRKQLSMLELIFEDGGYFQFNELAGNAYRNLAEFALANGQNGDALDLLERTADCVSAADTLPEHAVFTSVLLRECEFNRTKHERLQPETHCYWLREVLTTNQLYEPLRSEPRFSALLERLGRLP